MVLATKRCVCPQLWLYVVMFHSFGNLQISLGIHPVHPRAAADVTSCCCQTNCEGAGRALPGLVLPRLQGITGHHRTCCWSGARDRVDTVHNTIMMQMQAAMKSLSELWTFSRGGRYKRLRLTVSEPEQQQLQAAVCGTRCRLCPITVILSAEA